jgi:hypothetical protein
VSDKNARTVLLNHGALGSGDVVFEGRLRLLYHADVVAILNKDVVNTPPAGTICPGTVGQNNIPSAMLFVLR